MSKPKPGIPQDKIALYDRLLAARPHMERKGKSAFLYTSLNGHMYTYLARDGSLGIRLSKEDKAAFEEIYQSPPFVQYGAVLQGYVTVPVGLFENTEALLSWLDRSHEFIKSLKPKLAKQ